MSSIKEKLVGKKAIIIAVVSILSVVGILGVYIYAKNYQQNQDVESIENATEIKPIDLKPADSAVSPEIQSPATVETPLENTKPAPETPSKSIPAPTTKSIPKPAATKPNPIPQNPKPTVEPKPAQPPVNNSEPDTTQPVSSPSQDRGAFDI